MANDLISLSCMNVINIWNPAFYGLGKKEKTRNTNIGVITDMSLSLLVLSCSRVSLAYTAGKET